MSPRIKRGTGQRGPQKAPKITEMSAGVPCKKSEYLNWRKAAGQSGFAAWARKILNDAIPVDGTSG